ncbi:Heavy-metal-associated domain [Musa troglodytarum]|uniref:Heavy-metal-associated domain n=1 Tax=Musa troglodytarum TaxID=320322 RepID=A0A9E7KA24_9LILI|nr:Heavy-metal-associated domain [Musa troglodytarum]
MSANMGCSHCRQRVSKVVSKMNTGLVDYMVDLQKKEVTMRGVVETKVHQGRNPNHTSKKKTLRSFLGFFRQKCCSS